MSRSVRAIGSSIASVNAAILPNPPLIGRANHKGHRFLKEPALFTGAFLAGARCQSSWKDRARRAPVARRNQVTGSRSRNTCQSRISGMRRSAPTRRQPNADEQTTEIRGASSSELLLSQTRRSQR